MRGAATQAMPVCIVEERQRSRCPPAAAPLGAAVVFWADLLADSCSCLAECIRTGENAMQAVEHEGVASRWWKDPNATVIFHAAM